MTAKKRSHKYLSDDDLPACAQGLAVCEVCGGWEGSLPSDCPGFPLSAKEQQRIYAGTLDYREGRWYTPRIKGQIIRIAVFLPMPALPLNSCDPWTDRPFSFREPWSQNEEEPGSESSPAELGELR